MITGLERLAMLRQCGNAGKETPSDPRQMLRFGNSRKVHGRHFDTGLGRNAKERHSLRGMAFKLKMNARDAKRLLRSAPVESMPHTPAMRANWATACDTTLPTHTLP